MKTRLENLEGLRTLCADIPNASNAIVNSLTFHFRTIEDIADELKTIGFGRRRLHDYLSLVEALADHGRVDLALATTRRILADLEATESEAAHLVQVCRDQITIFERLQTASPPSRPIISDDFRRDVIRSKQNGGNKIAIVFTGLNGRPLIGTQLLDRYLAQAGFDAVYLRDNVQRGFNEGVASLGPARSDTTAYIRGLMEVYDPNTSIVVGTSLGTFGAITNALHSGAKRFALFGPVTAVGDIDVAHRFGDHRADDLLRTNSDSVKDEDRRLWEFLATAPEGIRIDVVYDEYDALDARYARSIGFIPGVKLHAIPARGTHNALRSSLATGLFSDLLERPSV